MLIEAQVVLRVSEIHFLQSKQYILQKKLIIIPLVLLILLMKLILNMKTFPNYAINLILKKI